MQMKCSERGGRHFGTTKGFLMPQQQGKGSVHMVGWLGGGTQQSRLWDDDVPKKKINPLEIASCFYEHIML